MKLIASANDLDEVLTLPRALVFVYVNWSIQARKSDVACEDFLASLRQEFPTEDIPVFRVDLSEQRGEVWDAVRRWLKNDRKPYDFLSYSGYGALLWLRSGKVAAFVHDAAMTGHQKLAATTRDAFGFGVSETPDSLAKQLWRMLADFRRCGRPRRASR